MSSFRTSSELLLTWDKMSYALTSASDKIAGALPQQSHVCLGEKQVKGSQY